MSWPMKLRAMSFAIGIGVVMTEVALVAAPVGFALWLAGVADAATITGAAAGLALATALVIIVPAHMPATGVKPPKTEGARK